LADLFFRDILCGYLEFLGNPSLCAGRRSARPRAQDHPEPWPGPFLRQTPPHPPGVPAQPGAGSQPAAFFQPRDPPPPGEAGLPLGCKKLTILLTVRWHSHLVLSNSGGSPSVLPLVDLPPSKWLERLDSPPPRGSLRKALLLAWKQLPNRLGH